MAEPNATQQALKKAQHDLAVALRGALQALENPAATPGLMGVAMQALAQAQNQWNAAVSRIPLEIMTDGSIHERDMPTPPPYPLDQIGVETEAEMVMAASLLGSTNARKWADAFLAINKNQAIDREMLVGWFANAIETGRSAARFTGSRLDP